MYNVTQILQRCKENNEKSPGHSDGEYIRCFKYDPRSMPPVDFLKAFMTCDNTVAMDYMRSIVDIHFFPKINMCPTSELRRVLKFYNPSQCLSDELRILFGSCHDARILTLEQLGQECGVSPIKVAGGRGGFVIDEGEASYFLTYLPNKERLWTPRACLMLMVRASDFKKRGKEQRTLCDKVRRDMMVAASQLDAESRIKKPAAAKPDPKPEPPKVSDDSKVVINMTPDLLTVMIKTAVTESVNAVWQKFMDNREIFLNT